MIETIGTTLSDLLPVEYKFGQNTSVTSAGVPFDIWDGPTALYPFPAAALATTVRSLNAADTAAGTGMQEVTVSGLDINFNEIIQTVDLNGLGAVALPTNLFRFNRAFGSRFGTGGTNAGNILVEQAGPVVVGNITAGRGQTLQVIYTVPILPGVREVSIKGVAASITRTQNVAIELIVQTRVPGSGGWRTRFVGAVTDTEQLVRDLRKGIDVEIGSDVRMTVTQSTSAPAIIVNGDIYVAAI